MNDLSNPLGWLVLVALTALLGLFAYGIGWLMREGLVDRDVDAIRRDGVPLRAEDEAEVRARARRRAKGELVGLALGVAVYSLFLMLGQVAPPAAMFGVLALPLGQTLGRVVMSLREPRVWGSRRAADLTPRRLESYVRPELVWAARGSAVLPVVTLVLAGLNLVAIGGADGRAAAGAWAGIVAEVVVLSLFAAATVVTSRVLAAGTPAEGGGALAWHEIARAQLLADLCSARAMIGVVGSAWPLLWGVTNGWIGYPDWYLGVAGLVTLVTVAGVVVLLLVEYQDRYRRWFRGHAGQGLLA